MIQSHFIGFSAIRARAFPGSNTPVPLAPGRAFPSGQILRELGLQSEYHQNEFFGPLAFGEASVSVQWETRLLQELIQAGNKADLDYGKDPGVPDLGQIRSLEFNTLIVLSAYRTSVCFLAGYSGAGRQQSSDFI